MSERMACFLVSPALIEQAMRFPDDHHITETEWDWASRSLRIYVKGPNLPIVETGQIVQVVRPLVWQETMPDGFVLYHWEWGIDSTPDQPAQHTAESDQSQDGDGPGDEGVQVSNLPTA